jgi:hypothetical protein
MASEFPSLVSDILIAPTVKSAGNQTEAASQKANSGTDEHSTSYRFFCAFGVFIPFLGYTA